MRYIVMVDFDYLTQYYKESLERQLFLKATKTEILGLNQDVMVVCFRSKEAAAHAWGFLKKHRQEVIGVVTEAILFPGSLFKGDDKIVAGLRAGLVLYEKIRAQFPTLPIIFLTCYQHDWPLLEPLIDGKICIAMKKYDTPPFDFAHKAMEFFRLAPAAEAVPAAV